MIRKRLMLKLNFSDNFAAASEGLIKLCFISSFISQCIFIHLPGRQPLQFYLCKGSFTPEEENLPLKLNWLSLIIFCPSMIMHILIYIRIRYYIKQQHSILPLTLSSCLKLEQISTMEKQSLSNNTTNICGVLALSLVFGTVFGMNQPKPSFFNQVCMFCFEVKTSN